MHGFFLYTVLSFTGPRALGLGRERKREESYIPVSIISIQPSSFFSLLPRLSLAPRRHFFSFNSFLFFVSLFSLPPPLPANAAVRLALSALPDSGRSFLASLSYPFRLSFHTRGPSQSTLASTHLSLRSVLCSPFPRVSRKAKWSFCSMLARAAGRHIIFSVFLLRGNLSSGEPVEVEVAEAAKVEYYRHS